MTINANGQQTMKLYYYMNDLSAQQLTFALAEKNIDCIQYVVDRDNFPIELLENEGLITFPTLIDRDLLIFDVDIALNYLDERFPYPPLLPIHPIERAELRLAMHRMRYEWMKDFAIAQNDPESKEAESARQRLTDELTSISALFNTHRYFLSDHFTLCDCYFAPLLWRLSEIQVELPEIAKKQYSPYVERIGERRAFQKSFHLPLMLSSQSDNNEM